MKKYLSFGGGVNSVAMMLYCLDKGCDFEAVFVNQSPRASLRSIVDEDQIKIFQQDEYPPLISS